MVKNPIYVIGKYSIIRHLCKWFNQESLIVKQLEPSRETDYSSALFLDHISFIRFGLSIDKLYSVSFCRRDIHVKRLINIFPLREYHQPLAKLTPELLFRIFNDTDFLDVRIDNISLYEEAEVQTAKEIWLSRINTVSSNECHDLDNQLIEYFQTPRLLYSDDVIVIENAGILDKSISYFKVSLKDSPLWVDETSKIFQSPAISQRYPRLTVSSNVFIPSGIRKISENVKQILNRLFKHDISSPMIVCVLIANGKDTCLNVIADQLCVNKLNFDCHDLWNVEGKSTKNILNGWIEKVNKMQPCICELQNLNVLNGNPSTDLEAGNKILGILSKSIQSFRGRAALFITVSKAELANLPIDITKLALFEYICDDLNAEDRFLFAKFVRKHYNAKVNLEWLSDSIRGLTLSELNQLINEASVCANKHNRQELHQFDFDWALNQRNKAFGESIGVPKIPTVTWNDVGGLDDVKQLISESLRANLNPNRLPNMRRSGIVLWGAPGCGKTLIAKAVANEFKMTFLSVKGPELLNQYIGQSEHNLRLVFEKARLASPSIIFFDELDSLAPNRGVAGDSSGVMDRMVSQLLSELDDLQTKPDCAVFVMGATNRPDLLDKCILSPGRFDKLIEVKMATDLESKIRILTPVCKNVNLAEDLSVEYIARQCPEAMSGAELSALISRAAMNAIRSVILHKQPTAKVRIEKEHIKQALENLI